MVLNGYDVTISCDRGLVATGKRTCENGKFLVSEEPIECKSWKLFYYVFTVIGAKKTFPISLIYI